MGRVNSMSSVGPNPAPTTGLMTANPSVVASRQTVSSKDDASIASGSSGCGSLTKKKTPIVGSGKSSYDHISANNRIHSHSDFQQGIDVDPQSIVSSIITDSGISETSETPLTTIFDRASSMAPVSSSQNLSAQQQPNVGEMGHSRNSSNTSQVCIRKISPVRRTICYDEKFYILDVERIRLQQPLRSAALTTELRW